MKNNELIAIDTLNNVWQGLSRAAATSGAGLLVTLALLMFMDALIRTDFELPEATGKKVDTVVVLDREDTTITERPKPPRPEPVEPPPPPLAQAAPTPHTLTPGVIPGPEFPHGPTKRRATIDRQAMPVVRIAPQYPPHALTRGIEGYVDLAFDITAAGQPTNIRVLHAEPEGIFERAAIRALKRWKYHPRVEDGVPLMQHGQATRIRFGLNE